MYVYREAAIQRHSSQSLRELHTEVRGPITNISEGSDVIGQ